MNRIIINTYQGKRKRSRHIYGSFVEHLGRCIYEGIWVGEGSPISSTHGIRSSIVAALLRPSMPDFR